MAKQTFTTGQVLTAAQVNALQTNDFNQTVDAKTASYVLVVGDRGKRIEFNTSGSVTCTVNTGIFDAGDTLIVQNRGAGAVTITAGTATVNTSGSLVVNQYESGTLYFISASAALWFGSNPGDITGVTTGATSGLTGGATSGTVDLKFNTTAKGGLLVGTGAGTVSELAVGANTYTLVADSTQSTGLKWAAPSSPSFVGCSLYQSAAQSIANATTTVVTFDSESFDTDAFHSTSTNTGRITIPSGKAGKYLLVGQSVMAGNATGRRDFTFRKNGTEISYNSLLSTGAVVFGATLSGIFDASVGDYFEFLIEQNSGGSLNTISGVGTGMKFFCQYLGA